MEASTKTVCFKETEDDLDEWRPLGARARVCVRGGGKRGLNGGETLEIKLRVLGGG